MLFLCGKLLVLWSIYWRKCTVIIGLYYSFSSVILICVLCVARNAESFARVADVLNSALATFSDSELKVTIAVLPPSKLSCCSIGLTDVQPWP